MTGYLTTHVLDTARGIPAAGLGIDLYRLDGEARTHLRHAVTNADGRTDAPILPEAEFRTGTYELVFHAGAWLDAAGVPPESPAFPRRDPDPLRHVAGGALPCAAAAVAVRLFHLSGELRRGPVSSSGLKGTLRACPARNQGRSPPRIAAAARRFGATCSVKVQNGLGGLFYQTDVGSAPRPDDFPDRPLQATTSPRAPRHSQP